MAATLRDDPERLERAVRFIYHKVRPYRDTSIQLVKLCEIFERMRPEDVADVIEDLYRRAAWGHYQYKELFNCLFHAGAIIERLGTERVSHMYAYSRDMPSRVVERLLIAPRNEVEVDLEREPELDNLTLGEKKQFAKGIDRRRLEKLLRDQHPHVIANLLKNPRIVEGDVLRIATRRPVNPRVLIEITKNPKWFRRTRIKEALILNPYTPFSVSLNLVPFFTRTEIHGLQKDPTLHLEIKDTIRDILELKDLYGQQDSRQYDNEAKIDDSEEESRFQEEIRPEEGDAEEDRGKEEVDHEG